jgi:hypothetical protein
MRTQDLMLFVPQLQMDKLAICNGIQSYVEQQMIITDLIIVCPALKGTRAAGERPGTSCRHAGSVGSWKHSNTFCKQ